MLIYEITDAFKKDNLNYAIVGGYALALHGYVRATMDVDFVLTLNEKDFTTAEKALQKIGLQSRIPVRAQDIIKMRKEFIKERNLIAWSFVDYKNPTRQVDILITENLTDIEVTTVSVGGRKIKVATLTELLRMKKIATCPQDLLDIENIKRLLDEKK